ncbi:MAG: type II toxin-antitoxin system PemK/MazF family toxin [Beijerinckiaceae bacterium]|nr:type II toxin-antitoxin system PemK/MazF family toxin [Beijerinckiaceae bacterium]
MSIPAPRPGLVICYSYLWATEYTKGIEGGRKNRPCVIIAARQIIEGREVVTVVPITHTTPANPDDAVEIPAALKAYLGLDDLPSWVVVTETNDFLWPGPDLWPLPSTMPNRYDYGMLPPRFFTHIRDKILQAHLRRRLDRVQRTE